MESTLDLGMSHKFPILEQSMTNLAQAVNRTLDATRWYVNDDRLTPPAVGTPQTDPQPEWVAMGGEICNKCQECIGDELCVVCN